MEAASEVQADMRFVDEVLEGYFQRLGAAPEAYATQYWRFLHGEGVQPDHRQHEVSDRDAQQIRIRLAGMK